MLMVEERPPMMTATKQRGSASRCRSASLALALLVACASASVVVTRPDQLEAVVGKTVTVIGTQTRTKIPTVCGADVDGEDALADREVIVEGVVKREVVTEVDPMTANRGTGVF